jgi:superfamily I DNA and/or RNA helicase
MAVASTSVGCGGLSVSVSSVDAYQGREADVILFSAVR